ncbi:hypothetical protein PLESTF_001837400 [Pleodorina starrii]|nr:hypothetical protein PLESTF_001837400 [Pleodorina starrii]
MQPRRVPKLPPPAVAVAVQVHVPAAAVAAGESLRPTTPSRPELQEGSQGAINNILLSADNAAELRNATATLEALFREMETEAPHASLSASSSACSLRLLLLYEVVGDEMLAALMPINALRNAAFLAADTPLVAMVDVDLSPSGSLAGQVLADSGRAARMVEDERAVWVVPAFDTHRRMNFSEREAVADDVVAGEAG